MAFAIRALILRVFRPFRLDCCLRFGGPSRGLFVVLMDMLVALPSSSDNCVLVGGQCSAAAGVHQKNYTRFRGHFEVAFGALLLSRHFGGHF